MFHFVCVKVSLCLHQNLELICLGLNGSPTSLGAPSLDLAIVFSDIDQRTSGAGAGTGVGGGGGGGRSGIELCMFSGRAGYLERRYLILESLRRDSQVSYLVSKLDEAPRKPCCPPCSLDAKWPLRLGAAFPRLIFTATLPVKYGKVQPFSCTKMLRRNARGHNSMAV